MPGQKHTITVVVTSGTHWERQVCDGGDVARPKVAPTLDVVPNLAEKLISSVTLRLTMCSLSGFMAFRRPSIVGPCFHRVSIDPLAGTWSNARW